MNLTEQLSKGIAEATQMTFAQVEEALANRDGRTVGELTALALAKKAAEGGMDAVKLMRELSKYEEAAELPRIEIRVVEPGEIANG